MTKLDLEGLAARIAQQGTLDAMRPVIEKELIHYEILDSLDRQGALSLIAFQGGTCLRLCYDGVRYSEDLDFAAGENFDRIDMDSIAAQLKSDLEARFDVSVHASSSTKKTASPNGVGMKKRWIVVDTAPERPDLPSQHVKVEVASVPAHTREVRMLSLHYPDLPQSYAMTLVACQSTTEILADKILSFADSLNRIRYRDLWDIPWLMQLPNVDKGLTGKLVVAKHGDYACETPIATMLEEGGARAQETLRSAEFAKEMRRFIPQDVYERTVGRPSYLELMGQRIAEAYALPGVRA